jgi:hypothetical protein
VNNGVDVNAVYDPGPLPISGNFLSHNRHDAVGKAFVGAGLVHKARVLTDPTIVQAAMLARVNRTYVFWAVKRWEQREKILAGLLPLVPPFIPKPVTLITPETITDAELAEVIRKAGITRTLDVAAMVEAAE